MANLNFKYGVNWAALKDKAVVDGTIYITKEEKAMYVDLDGARHRIGQIIDFQTWDDFNKNITVPPQHPDAYYYIINQNALLRYDSVNSKWNQINSTATIAGDLESLTNRVAANEAGIDNIKTQITSLQAADAANNKAISDEAAARAEAVTDLQGKIDAEASRADAAEKANAANISKLQTDVDNIEDTYAKTSVLEEKVTDLQGQISSNDTDIANLQDALDNASTGIKARLTAVEEKATTNASDISGLKTDISAIQSGYVKITDYNEKMSALDDSIAGNASDISDLQAELDTASTGIKARLTTVEGKAQTNANNITDLITRADNVDTKITALEAADTANSKAIADEEKAREEAVTDLQGKITAENTRATGVEAELKTSIDDNKAAIDNHTSLIGTNTTNITNLTNLVGTLPEDSNADTVVDFVIEQMEAADAMTYKGGISKWSNLPTTGIEAGFTYVVTADFEQGGESYYAGDLVIANVDQTGDTYAGGWTHVKTGYVASQENKLVKDGASDNTVKLTSYTGTNLGSMTVKSDNLTVSTTTTAANATTIQIDFAWGTF